MNAPIASAPPGPDDVLSFRNVGKSFLATAALTDVSLDLRRGEILALLGENGAGKSTLIKILAGVFPMDTGSITYAGRPIIGTERRRLPIAFIHQDLGLIEWMTVAENICLTLGYPRRYGMIDWDGGIARARLALDRLDADIDPERRVNELSRTEKSLVAIARALAAEARVLVLDEPTASLPGDEVARLFAALGRLRAQGVAMIYVSHRLDEVFELADRVVVLRDGRVVGQCAVADTTPEKLILMIVGREPSQVFRRPAERSGKARLILRGLCAAGAGPVDCALHAGEIVGLVGLRGAGQEVIGRALFGLHPVDAGEIVLDGRPVRPGSPQEAIAAGIHLVCGDRGAESVVSGLTIRENMFLNLDAAGHGALRPIALTREMSEAQALGGRIGLSPNDCALLIENLSGGNQQKVVVGRWLHLAGKVIVFEDPTAGVDVGAKAEIYRLFDVALSAGAVILIAGTDFEEIAKVCHRALVFDRGRVVTELSVDTLSVENLLGAASACIGPHLSARTSPGVSNAVD
jgi:ribose transport system ATP-binding protein